MKTSVIFARNHANIIGVDQQLPWSFKEDMQWFKQQTLGHSTIMGRKTFESFNGHLLENRFNVVISRKPFVPGMIKPIKGSKTGFMSAFNLNLAMQMAKAEESVYPEAFVIGGASVIKEAIPLVDRIVMTTVGMSVDESKYREVTKLDVRGLEGYYNEYMTVDGLPFKLTDGEILSLVNRMDGLTYHVHFTVHERVR
jgi:dihydrofolate reductase